MVPSNRSSIQGSRREAASSSIGRRVSWYEMALMDKQGPEQSQQEQIVGFVAEQAPVSEGASTGHLGGGVEVPSSLRGSVNICSSVARTGTSTLVM